MEKIDFKKNKYDADLIIGSFDLLRSTECDILNVLLSSTGEISERYKTDLEHHRKRLLNEGEYWNEEELKMHFLSHIFFLSEIDEPKKIKLFYERILKDEIDGHNIYVKCDCMIATPFGINTPKAPYFFLQEFKKAKKPDDPEGQMLLAMLSAQHRNNNGKPIYGSWIQGKNWVFTTLHSKNYCISRQYDATIHSDLEQIIFILRNLKQIILKELV
jgi:hypothetical protein